ncbi:hypothetical protein FRC11_003523 [Ceratobasidium sp. 423]|nr:hypothetical protein FRC11_003523 [Ceratobasidium sp. 423]
MSHHRDDFAGDGHHIGPEKGSTGASQASEKLSHPRRRRRSPSPSCSPPTLVDSSKLTSTWGKVLIHDDTPKIAQHRAEVSDRLNRSEVRKRAKAERQDFTLDDVGSSSDSESDLPAIAEVGRNTDSVKEWHDNLSRDASDMEDSEMERIWAGEKRKKNSNKSGTLSKSSKVKAVGPAKPAIPSPKYSKANTVSKRGQPQSPKHVSDKHLRNKGHSRGRSKERCNKNGKQEVGSSKHSTKSSTSRPYGSSHASSARSSSRATTTDRGRSRASSARSDSRAGSVAQFDDDDDDKSGDDEDKADGGSSDGDDDSSEGGSDDLSESNEESDGEPTKHHNKNTNSKVKSGDFKGVEREILEDTIHLSELYLVTTDYFPTPQQLVEMTKGNWEKSVRKRDLRRRDFPVMEQVLIAVRLRLHSFRGRLCDNAVKAGLLSAYGLAGVKQGSPEAKSIMNSILPHGVHQKVGAPAGTGYFQHTFLKDATCQMLFSGCKPLGKLHPDKFEKFPLRTLVIICAIIHGVIEAYTYDKKTSGRGMKKEDQMSQDQVCKYYKIHRKTSKFFESEQKLRCDYELLMLYKYCIEQVGTTVPAQASKKRKIEVLTAEHFANDDPSPEDWEKLGSLLVTKTGSPPPEPTPPTQSLPPKPTPQTKSNASLSQPRPRPKQPEPTSDDEECGVEPERGLGSVPPARVNTPSDKAHLSPKTQLLGKPAKAPESEERISGSCDSPTKESPVRASTPSSAKLKPFDLPLPELSELPPVQVAPPSTISAPPPASAEPKKMNTNHPAPSSNPTKRRCAHSPLTDPESPVRKKLTVPNKQTPTAIHPAAHSGSGQTSNSSRSPGSRAMQVSVVLKVPKSGKKGPASAVEAGKRVVASKCSTHT